MTRIVLYCLAVCLTLPCLIRDTFASTPTLNLRDFGAVGDGVTDDGPAFQEALDALATAGGGTLFVPEGKYVIATPVSKNFTGLASSITIAGVESLTAVAPPTAPGHELAAGLDLLSEVYPRTGDTLIAISISGLQSLVVKDIAFVGTPTVITDAAITLLLKDIDKAQIKHSEFYGLATLIGGGGIVEAIRSDLEITQCKFLGSTGNSGEYVPIVQNIEWRGITVVDTTFLDYGLRSELFSKTGVAAPISWINIGNAAQPTTTSPRREVVLRNVFLDEGGYWGLSSLPYRYTPPSAPIDLIYITGLVMNVSNFGQFGHQLYNAERVFIEKSSYGWSHNAFAAIALRNIGTGILDHLSCVADADRIYADSNTKELTVINSTYSELDSSAQITKTVNTATDEEDPVQYVRARFEAVLGRQPDAAAHFYWSDLLIDCFDDAACRNNTKQALDDYLANSPSATFAISGRVTDQDIPLPGVAVTLRGSQTVATTTDTNGNYLFANLPTSGRYVITPAKTDYAFDPEQAILVTPSGDQLVNFNTKLRTHLIKGTIKVGGSPLPGVTVTLSGSSIGNATTDNNGEYSFTLNTGGNYVLKPIKNHYSFNPITTSVTDLNHDVQVDFSASLIKHSISGSVLDAKGVPLPGVVLTLSGAVNRTTTTASDGSYSFADIDAGASLTVTAAKEGYLMSPLVQTFNDLSADGVADFQARLLPILLTVTGSDRAVALELTQLVEGPFPLTTTLLSAGRNRTRIMIFGTNLGLLNGEGVEAITAEAEDAAHIRYPLRVEFVSPLRETPEINQIVLRLTEDLANAGDVLVTVTIHGLTSNKVRIAIAR